MISSKPNHYPKPPSANTITLRVRTSTCRFWRDTVQSIAVVFSPFWRWGHWGSERRSDLPTRVTTSVQSWDSNSCLGLWKPHSSGFGVHRLRIEPHDGPVPAVDHFSQVLLPSLECQRPFVAIGASGPKVRCGEAGHHLDGPRVECCSG